ncbi:MAG: putative membrane protein [Chitinophagales bacterium]|jgi:uncharacterized membrane protein
MHRLVVLIVSITVCLNVLAATNLNLLTDKRRHPKVFSDELIYTTAEHNNRLALQAISSNSASGLVLNKKIDLTITTYI